MSFQREERRIEEDTFRLSQGGWRRIGRTAGGDVEGFISNPVRVLCKGVEAPPCSKDDDT